MKPFEVYGEIFDNLPLFLMFTFIFICILYFGVRRLAPAGYFDPLHFYWTFTFGTAYAIVAGLYAGGHVSFFYAAFVFFMGFLFIFFLRLFSAISGKKLSNSLLKFLKPQVGFKSFILILIVLYFIAVLYQISVVGFGMFSSTNRFEQARGHGAIIRFLDAIVPFLTAAFAISLHKLKERKGVNFIFCSCFLFFLFFLFFNSIMNGSKMAFLAYIYSAVLGLSLYKNKKPEFRFFKLSLLFLVVFLFAIFAQSFDLRNQSLDGSNASYLPGSYFAVERLMLRVIGNADKYYLGLPNQVIEEIEVDNVAIRFISPLVGSTNLSKVAGYNVNDYGVGRQIMLFHTPSREVAGGPTSHFDLFSYKYFGLYFSWVWVVVMSAILSVIIKIRNFSHGDIYSSAIGAQMWISSLPILLEPPIGVAKILDILIIYTFVNFLAFFLLLVSKTPTAKLVEISGSVRPEFNK